MRAGAAVYGLKLRGCMAMLLFKYSFSAWLKRKITVNNKWLRLNMNLQDHDSVSKIFAKIDRLSALIGTPSPPPHGHRQILA